MKNLSLIVILFLLIGCTHRKVSVELNEKKSFLNEISLKSKSLETKIFYGRKSVFAKDVKFLRGFTQFTEKKTNEIKKINTSEIDKIVIKTKEGSKLKNVAIGGLTGFSLGAIVSLIFYEKEEGLLAMSKKDRTIFTGVSWGVVGSICGVFKTMADRETVYYFSK